jgi:hypothetical protein
MSLDAKWTAVKNWEEVCFEDREATPIRPKGRYIKPQTEAIVFATMFVGMNRITEENWNEFYARLFAWERAHGQLLFNGFDEKTGQKIPYYLSEEVVRQHIGLHTNASNLTAKQFAVKLLEAVYADRGVKKTPKKKKMATV